LQCKTSTTINGGEGTNHDRVAQLHAETTAFGTDVNKGVFAGRMVRETTRTKRETSLVMRETSLESTKLGVPTKEGFVIGPRRYNHTFLHGYRDARPMTRVTEINK
jgi:hypothetical protein